MSKIDDVRKAMVEAMKAKDKDRKDSLSMLLSAAGGPPAFVYCWGP